MEEIKDWMIHKQKILQEWGMERVLKQGYRALFYGPPGTGKTLTATLLGKYLNQDVYRIDLSQVVSKFIGETEKNLGRIFDRAEHKNWILFFDEADALFGKRTKVNDAHDRFANQEVSFLLQRVEDYNGIIILASNKRENVDEAFSRRFQSIVHFPLPGVPERTALWKQILPEFCKLERGLTLEQVAKEFEVAGGAMLNAARHAVLMAACRGDTVIRKRELAEGIRRELRKDGRML